MSAFVSLSSAVYVHSAEKAPEQSPIGIITGTKKSFLNISLFQKHLAPRSHVLLALEEIRDHFGLIDGDLAKLGVLLGVNRLADTHKIVQLWPDFHHILRIRYALGDAWRQMADDHEREVDAL